MKLRKEYKLQICPTAPFAFDPTFYKPDHFPSPDTHWESGIKFQTMLWKGKKLGLVIENKGGIEKPKILVRVFSNSALSSSYLSSLKQELVWRYNLDLDLSEFYRLARGDKELQKVIEKMRGLRPAHPNSLYEYLIIAVVLQNATVKRSVQMLKNLFEEFGTLLSFAGKTLYCFWPPSKIGKVREERLRELKLGYRAKNIKLLSERLAKLPGVEQRLRKRSRAEQKEFLLSLYGIGPASVGYIMFDVFHRWDFLEHISPWEQKIYTKLIFKKDYKKELVPVSTMLEEFQKRWGKYKGLAIHYFWESLWWDFVQGKAEWLKEEIRM